MLNILGLILLVTGLFGQIFTPWGILIIMCGTIVLIFEFFFSGLY